MYHSIGKDGLNIMEIVSAVGGEAHNIRDNIQVYNICTDTRADVKGSLFVALKGEKYDGHAYISDAFTKGAAACVCQRRPADDVPFIKVDSTLEALGKIAMLYRGKFDLPVVAVTGSVGKTTTKEAICAAISPHFSVCKTEKNFNNEVGLPQTVLSLTSDHGAAVIEMGMVERGEISNLSRITRPTIAVITNIGTSHIGHLGSRENIFLAKSEITDGLCDGGTLIVNGDDDMLRRAANPRGDIVFVGIENAECDFCAKNVKETAGGVSFDVKHGNTTINDIFFPSLGRHSVYAALFAVACATVLGVSDDEMRRGLTLYRPVEMRQNIVQCGDFTKIVDCYNASPESMRAGIDVLLSEAKGRGGRSVAVLGKMHELGDFSPMLHKQTGAYAARADVVMIFGDSDDAKNLANGAMSAGREPIMLGNDIEKAAQIIRSSIVRGDVILIKASRAERLERLAERIK